MNARDPIYLELVDFVAGGTTPDDIIDFHPSAAQQRVNELIEREADQYQLNAVGRHHPIIQSAVRTLVGSLRAEWCSYTALDSHGRGDR
jgi:hypothetical protein